MQFFKLTGAIVLATSLSGCLESDVERGLVGAGAGVVVAEATGGNHVVGAVGGAAAGVFCDDVGICRRSR